MTPEGRARLRRVAAATVTLLAAGWLVDRVDGPELAASLGGAEPAWLGAACLLVPLQTVLAGERWGRVSTALGVPLSRRSAWTELAVSTAVNQVLPGGVAGDVLRVWRQRHRGLASAARAALVDRAWGQTVLAGAVLAGVVGWPPTVARPPGLHEGLLLAVGVVVGVWVAPRKVPLLGPLSADLRHSARVAPAAPLVLSLTLLAAILAGFAACGLAVGHPPGPWLWTAAPVALLAMSLPVSAGGWGLREGSLVVLLPLLGWTPADALAVSLLFGLTFLVGALPGLGFLASPRRVAPP